MTKMMNEDVKDRLRKKGWSEQDLLKAESIFDRAASGPKSIDLFVYWSALIIALILNVVVSGIFIPLMLAFQGLVLYSFVFVVSLFFGWIFYILIKDIENMEVHHHIIAGLFIPAIGLVNMFVIVNLTNKVITNNIPSQLLIPLSHPLQLSIVYVIGFTIPYLVSQIRK